VRDRQVEVPGKFMIAFVTAGYAHDGPCAVAREYVFGDPDRNPALIEGVEGIGSCEYTADPLFCHPLAFASAFYISDVLFDRFYMVLRGDLFHQLMLRCDNHEVNAENSIGSGCIYPECIG